MALDSSELNILREVVSLPTAPFCESAVQGYIRKWAEDSGIGFAEDPSGNMLLTLKGKGRQSGNPWVLQAHMDHPGFELISRRGRVAKAWFRGGVQESYFPGAEMCFLPEGQPPVAGKVISVKRDAASGFLCCRIQLEEPADLSEGTPGMWKIVPWRRRGDTLSLRVADDLCGVASILITLQRLKQSGCKRTVHALLTRAEEVGFVGALSAAKHGTIDSSWPVLGIEMSKEQPGAKRGKGAVVRVGDASTVFDPALTGILRQKVRELEREKATAQLKYVSYLMPGGSTESTGLALMGYRTCAVCLPLGNYHNMGTSKIVPEKINLMDVESLVALLVEVVQLNPDKGAETNMKKRLLENHRKRSSLL